jgi:hypothetical protein
LPIAAEVSVPVPGGHAFHSLPHFETHAGKIALLIALSEPDK